MARVVANEEEVRYIMTGCERVKAMVQGEAVDHLPFMPITMMFAADCAGVKYRDYATDYRALVEAQLCVADRFDFDYVSCISDPAREAADCGAAIQVFDDQPPAVFEAQARLADKADLNGMKMPDPHDEGRMSDRVRAAALFRERVGGKRLIEGWVEGPCAEAADLRGINTVMADFYEDGKFVQRLFEFTLNLGLRFARAQVEAGVDLIGIGDAAASLVGPAIYEEYVWPYEKRLVDGIHKMGAMVRLHICGNTTAILEGIGRLGCEIVDLDWMVSLAAAREVMGPGQVLLGNIDPVSVVRNGTPEQIRDALDKCHRDAGARYIVGAGCEIPRGTPAENVAAMRDYARSQK